MRSDPPFEPDRPDILDRLPREQEPPAALEDRVVGALGARGMLAPSRRPAWRTAAAAIALFVAGALVGAFTAGRNSSPPVTAEGSRYVLLLYEDQGTTAAAKDQTDARVDEYRRWARGVAREGTAISGERLQDSGTRLARLGTSVTTGPEAPPGGARLGGYFIITARSAADAERVAASCPHLQYGGQIVLKAIDPV